MTKGDIIEIHNPDKTLVTRGLLHAPRNGIVKNLVIIQPGLGSSNETSDLTNRIRDASRRVFFDDYSVFAVDHPSYGLNSGDPGKEDFTIWKCRDATCLAVQYALDHLQPQKVICVGNSLGFWTLFQSMEIFGNDTRILALLGKSGIASYKKILARNLAACRQIDPTNGGWDELFRRFKLNQKTGLCSMQVNPGDNPIELHRHFFESIDADIHEATHISPHTEVEQGGFDHYTPPAEMREHNDGKILVREYPNAGHDLANIDIGGLFSARIRELFEIQD